MSDILCMSIWFKYFFGVSLIPLFCMSLFQHFCVHFWLICHGFSGRFFNDEVRLHFLDFIIECLILLLG